jgi:hypothetical protein
MRKHCLGFHAIKHPHMMIAEVNMATIQRRNNERRQNVAALRRCNERNHERDHLMNMQGYLKNRVAFPMTELDKHRGDWVAWSPDGTRLVAVPSLGGAMLRYRPIIPIRVIGLSGSRLIDGCLDCGSDDTIFPLSLARKLAIDLTGAPQGFAHPVGGTVVPYWYAPRWSCA